MTTICMATNNGARLKRRLNAIRVQKIQKLPGSDDKLFFGKVFRVPCDKPRIMLFSCRKGDRIENAVGFVRKFFKRFCRALFDSVSFECVYDILYVAFRERKFVVMKDSVIFPKNFPVDNGNNPAVKNAVNEFDGRRFGIISPKRGDKNVRVYDGIRSLSGHLAFQPGFRNDAFDVIGRKCFSALPRLFPKCMKRIPSLFKSIFTFERKTKPAAGFFDKTKDCVLSRDAFFGAVFLELLREHVVNSDMYDRHLQPPLRLGKPLPTYSIHKRLMEVNGIFTEMPI